MKCAVRRAVKVISRRVRERTIEKTIHTYKHSHKYILWGFPLNTTYSCSLTNYKLHQPVFKAL